MAMMGIVWNHNSQLLDLGLQYDFNTNVLLWSLWEKIVRKTSEIPGKSQMKTKKNMLDVYLEHLVFNKNIYYSMKKSFYHVKYKFYNAALKIQVKIFLLTCKMVGCVIWCPLTNVSPSACNGVTVQTPSCKDIIQCFDCIDGPNNCSVLVFAEPTYRQKCQWKFIKMSIKNYGESGNQFEWELFDWS